jgi:hypothetical protein
MQGRWKAAQRAEVAGHHEQAAAGSQHGRKRAQHPRRAEVVGVDERRHLLAPRLVGGEPCGGVRHDDIDPAVSATQLLGETGDSRAVTYVQHLGADLGGRRGDPRSGLLDTPGVASGQIDDVGG